MPTEKPHLFTIRPERWYAWVMAPGYESELQFRPYGSSIWVEWVRPLKTGTNCLNLRFYNAFYPGGVRDFELDLRVLKRTRAFLSGVIDYGDKTQRTALIHELNILFLQRYAPWLLEKTSLSSMGGSWASDMQAHLDRTLRGIR